MAMEFCMSTVTNSDGVDISYEQIRRAQGDEPYPMRLKNRREVEAVLAAVNQGIDSHLEACFVPDRGDRYELGTFDVCGKTVGNCLDCEVSPESLPVLIRRLSELEHEDEEVAQEAWLLADDILGTLELEEDE